NPIMEIPKQAKKQPGKNILFSFVTLKAYRCLLSSCIQTNSWIIIGLLHVEKVQFTPILLN
ncbi:MAG: hypothetical protein V1789_01065, partial [PVC group bacterium]